MRWLAADLRFDVTAVHLIDARNRVHALLNLDTEFRQSLIFSHINRTDLARGVEHSAAAS